MYFAERLKATLTTLPVAERSTVQVVNPTAPRCVLWIVSPSFEGLDEVDRQRIVWDHLRKSFSDDELEQIEFIFTDAPSERSVAT